jgi:N-acetylmuramoyl-L-alanine amidase
MRKICSLLFFMLILASPGWAAIEAALQGEEPVVIDEIYHRNGLIYIPIDDLLSAVELEGKWDAIAHVYRIKSERGTAIISPGSQFLRIGEQFIPIKDKPRFIDNRLRVTERFVLKHLASLVSTRLFYRNLDPVTPVDNSDASALDRLFSFMLNKKKPTDAATLRAVGIDPGHGGHDPGSIGIDGVKEKDATLAVALRLQKIVKMNLGVPVYLSRDADYALSLQEHLKPATEPDVDALLLLHAQSAVEPAPSGIFLYIRNDDLKEDSESLRLASSLSNALRAEGLIVQGIVEAPLLPLGRGNLPTVLVEMGYLSHPEDSKLLTEEEGQVRIATGLFNGLKNFGQKARKGFN